jgi:rRNA maturation endonuclease Nob1
MFDNTIIKEQSFSLETWKAELSSKLWHCYICNRCKLIRWHPLNHCHRCGTKLIRLVGKTEHLQQELYKNGYSESGI